jgi:hypothetical protein
MVITRTGKEAWAASRLGDIPVLHVIITVKKSVASGKS